MAFLRRLLSVPLRPAEWAEVLTNTIAVGWAYAFLHADIFGPPGTTVHHIVSAFGPDAAAGLAFATALSPAVSIAAGSRWLRFISTLVCGFMWSAIWFVSVRAGLCFSPATCTASVCLAALFRSQVSIIAQRCGHERSVWA